MEEVDTLSFGILFVENLNRKEIAKKIKQQMFKKYDEEGEEYYINKVENYSFYFKEKLYCLIITLQHNLIVGKTAEQIKLETGNMIRKHFALQNEDYTIDNLNRLDYKNDYVLKDEEELPIIKNILTKTVDKVGKNYVKSKDEKNEKFYKKKYRSKGSGYMEMVIYDKGKEMQLKAEKNECTYEEANKYKNVIRTEVRVKNGRLNYEKYKNGTSKSINNYYDLAVGCELYNYYVKKVFGKRKFYRIDIAIKIVQRAKQIKNKMKEKLCYFLKYINRFGMSKAKEKYNKTTFRSYLKRLEELCVNAITFDRKINGKEIKAKEMENFAFMK